MAEIHMIARFEAAPGKREELLQRLQAMEIATQGEPGCLYYILNVDIHNPDIFYFREGWTGLDALAQHDVTPHVIAIRESEKDLTSNGITVSFMRSL